MPSTPLKLKAQKNLDKKSQLISCSYLTEMSSPQRIKAWKSLSTWYFCQMVKFSPLTISKTQNWLKLQFKSTNKRLLKNQSKFLLKAKRLTQKLMKMTMHPSLNKNKNKLSLNKLKPPAKDYNKFFVKNKPRRTKKKLELKLSRKN